MLEYKLPEDVVHGIIRGAVNIERRFICEASSCDLVGMNSELMTRYIEFAADRLLFALGRSKLFKPAVGCRGNLEVSLGSKYSTIVMACR